VQSPVYSLTASCNEGEYMSGIENGAILCTPFPGTNPSTGTPTITSKVTGRIWMALDLGQTKAAQDYGDQTAQGSLYQWGRGTDGHESRTSEISDEEISATESSSKFITEETWFSETEYPSADWNALNNPCPQGFVVPTVKELLAEYPDGVPADYSNNVLKLGGSFGYRSAYDGQILNSPADPRSPYWTADVDVKLGYYQTAPLVHIHAGDPLDITISGLGYGASVRCIKAL
jgi:hypothetical protein